MQPLLSLLAAFSAASVLVAGAAPAAPRPLGDGSLVQALVHARQSTRACRAELGLVALRAEHSPWALPRSLGYRKWALGLWRLRARGCALRLRELHLIREWPWGRLAGCESGGRWSLDAEFDGGLQFLPSTWLKARVLPAVRRYAERYAYAYDAPPWVQVRAAEAWLGVTSWEQWPRCSRLLGLR